MLKDLFTFDKEIMAVMKSHTHCQAALAAHSQSQAESVLSVRMWRK